MAITAYEGMFLLDPIKYSQDPERVSGQIPEMIQQFGGEVLVSRLWEERKLAYPIKGHRRGVYWLTYFRLEGTKLAELRRQCEMSDNILRVLFLRLDPRIVDMLVEHAKSGQVVFKRAQAVEFEQEVDEESEEQEDTEQDLDEEV